MAQHVASVILFISHSNMMNVSHGSNEIIKFINVILADVEEVEALVSAFVVVH